MERTSERGRRFSLPTIRIFTEFGFAWSSNSIIPLIQSQPQTPFPLSQNTPPAATHARYMHTDSCDANQDLTGSKPRYAAASETVCFNKERKWCVWVSNFFYLFLFPLSVGLHSDHLAFLSRWEPVDLSKFLVHERLSSHCRSLDVSYTLSSCSLALSLLLSLSLSLSETTDLAWNSGPMKTNQMLSLSVETDWCVSHPLPEHSSSLLSTERE